jgi:hypothetical protein
MKEHTDYRIILTEISKEEYGLTCHMWIRPRYPANSHSAWPYMDFNQRSKLPVRHFLCTWSSSMSKSQLDTCRTASSINGRKFPWRTDSSRSLCQNSSNAGSSMRISSWTFMNLICQKIVIALIYGTAYWIDVLVTCPSRVFIYVQMSVPLKEEAGKRGKHLIQTKFL